jgi:hypothetical protein
MDHKCNINKKHDLSNIHIEPEVYVYEPYNIKINKILNSIIKKNIDKK